jgi:hypothetical protein
MDNNTRKLVVTSPNDISARWACSMVKKCKEKKKKGWSSYANVRRKIWTTRILTLEMTERAKDLHQIFWCNWRAPYRALYFLIPSAVHVAFQKMECLLQWVFHYFIFQNTWLFSFFFFPP